MGALPQSRWGGRWTAVYSLWTYVHRVLHVLGIAAVDREEVALLSGTLIRIRTPNRSLVLSHHASPLHPDEPLGWTSPADTPLPHTLFLLHYDHTQPAHPDRARLATAHPTQTSPRAWIRVDPDTGTLSLTTSEAHAAVFDLRASSSHPAAVSLACVCSAARYLSVHPATSRARVCSQSPAPLLINAVPLPPTLRSAPTEPPPSDCTLATAYAAPRIIPVRLQSRARGWFLASKPGAPLAAAGGKDAGWDGFTLEYDSPTCSTVLRDSRGLPLGFGPELNELVAAAEEGGTGEGDGPQGERFFVRTVAKDDRIVLRSRKGYLSARRGGRIALSKGTQPGRREEFYLRLALPSMMDLSTPRLTLRARGGGARQVDASVLVPAPASIAYEVLCDYNGFHEFIRDASASEVLQRRSETELTVRMVQCHSFLMLTIPMEMVLNVLEDKEERVVTMDLERGLGVKQYKGRWQAVERSDGRCLLKCSLLAATAVPAPGFLIDGLMSHATHSTMEQLRVECIRRSSLEHPKPAKLPSRKERMSAAQHSKYVEVPPNTVAV